MTEDRTPENAPQEGSATPSGDAPPPLAPYVTPSEPEPHAPLGNQASGAAGAYVPPPVPPPAVQQPAVAWAAPPAAAATTGSRTVLAAIAGILLLLGGILGGIAGLAVAIVGGSFASSLGDIIVMPGLEGGDPGALLGGMVAFVGVLIFIYSLVYFFAGIGVLRNRGWGRVMGLIVGILSGLIWLGAITTPDQPNVQDSIVGSLIALGIHVYIVVVLLLFWRTKPATA